MVLDYKDVSFSFKRKKTERLKKRLKLILLLIIIVFIIVLVKYFLEKATISKINTYLLSNDLIKAENKLNQTSLLFHNKELNELKALLYLYNQEYNKSIKLFEKISRSDINYKKHINLMLDNAEYKGLLIYSKFLEKNKININIYKSIYYLSQYDINKSKKYLKLSKNNKVKAVLSEIINNINNNKINYIFDINDKPIAYFDLKKRKTFSKIKGFDFSDFNTEIKEGLKFYKLTINSNIQNKLNNLFKNFTGNFILLKLPENSIIAAYSNTGNKSNSVFTLQYEPGSIIKILSLFAYLNSNKKNLFPYYCKGLITFGNKIFYDWMKHDLIKSPQQALALSCNTAHAMMGLTIGYEKYAEVLNKFFFNHKPIFNDFIRFDFGRYDKSKTDDYSLADLSIGLNIISITTFHSAFISSLIAQSGFTGMPYIIKNKKNILKIAFYNNKPENVNVYNKNPNFLTIKKAMEEVVNNKRGTGRRAKVDFVKIAIKTGTAGDKKYGLDSIITGFFPSNNPEYAFAFWLNGAGKAEFKGAYFLKDFLKAMYNK